MLTLRTKKISPYTIELYDNVGASFTYGADNLAEFFVHSYWLSYYYYHGQVGDADIFNAMIESPLSHAYTCLLESIDCLKDMDPPLEVTDIYQLYQGQYMHFTPANIDIQIVELLYMAAPDFNQWPRILEGFTFQYEWDDVVALLRDPVRRTFLEFATLHHLLTSPEVQYEAPIIL